MAVAREGRIVCEVTRRGFKLIVVCECSTERFVILNFFIKRSDSCTENKLSLSLSRCHQFIDFTVRQTNSFNWYWFRWNIFISLTVHFDFCSNLRSMKEKKKKRREKKIEFDMVSYCIWWLRRLSSVSFFVLNLFICITFTSKYKRKEISMISMLISSTNRLRHVYLSFVSKFQSIEIKFWSRVFISR